MANNPKFAVASRNTELNAMTPDFDAGFLRLYTGAQPASPDVALAGTHTMLAELVFQNPGFQAAASGVVVSQDFEAPVLAHGTAVASGLATWWRCFKTDGTTALLDGTIAEGDVAAAIIAGPSAQDMTISKANIVAGEKVYANNLIIRTLPYP